MGQDLLCSSASMMHASWNRWPHSGICFAFFPMRSMQMTQVSSSSKLSTMRSSCLSRWWTFRGSLSCTISNMPGGPSARTNSSKEAKFPVRRFCAVCRTEPSSARSRCCLCCRSAVRSASSLLRASSSSSLKACNTKAFTFSRRLFTSAAAGAALAVSISSTSSRNWSARKNSSPDCQKTMPVNRVVSTVWHRSADLHKAARSATARPVQSTRAVSSVQVARNFFFIDRSFVRAASRSAENCCFLSSADAGGGSSGGAPATASDTDLASHSGHPSSGWIILSLVVCYCACGCACSDSDEY
mmetsp:Transcript_2204/g.5192  ORF Transcript_2204/g.5192 Transcript_2204/m.5192 type:complete len:300 (-) Transcript_2204:91-990(-)